MGRPVLRHRPGP
ncbi:hypothetical protein E2C01_081807 [Portunus trituberculatus]|uniref:Uncharacterized protein n=1 Tax=Portunus trituberculatus TaxID=210409 RepID=A0A5B7ISU4_PORTR|nr:hypothetical protein [Portunus trituberculatus]